MSMPMLDHRSSRFSVVLALSRGHIAGLGRVSPRGWQTAMSSWMKRQTLIILLLVCGPLAANEVAIEVVDDSGALVRRPRPAQRIVTLAPHLAETLFAAGAGSKLVGVVEFSDYPASVRTLPQVGGYSRLDLEAVVALKPDLVIAWQSGNTPAHIEKLRTLGIPVYLSQPARIEDVAVEIERLGILAGTVEPSRLSADSFRQRLAGLVKQYEKRPVVRTFYQVWKEPLVTVGGQQIISSVIHLCGGENIFAALGSMAPTVSVEAVIAANPEVIVASGMDASRPEWLDDWKRWTSIIAVARDNLFFVRPELIQRHTPRLLDGAEQLCTQLETARRRRPE